MRARDDQSPTVIISFQLPINLLERVRAVARRRDVSMAAAVRAGLRLWLAAIGEVEKR